MAQWVDMIDTKKKTFIVDIIDSQNETWQGSLSWVQGNQNINFRSALELIKLIDSVVDQKDNLNDNSFKFE